MACIYFHSITQYIPVMRIVVDGNYQVTRLLITPKQFLQ